MFGSFGAPEIIIIALVVILLFGVGKISGLGKELGSSIKEFRRAVKDPDEDKTVVDVTPPQQYVQQAPPVQQQYPPAQPQYAPPPQQQYSNGGPPPQQQYAAPAAPAAPPQAPVQPTQGDGKNIF